MINPLCSLILNPFELRYNQSLQSLRKRDFLFLCVVLIPLQIIWQAHIAVHCKPFASPLQSSSFLLSFPFYINKFAMNTEREIFFFFLCSNTSLAKPTWQAPLQFPASLCQALCNTIHYKLIQSLPQTLQFSFAKYFGNHSLRFFFSLFWKHIAGSWQVLAGPASVCQCLASRKKKEED